MRLHRCIILLLILTEIPESVAWAQSLEAEVVKDSLKISARQLYFLSDTELERLHNGLTVNLIISLTVSMEGSRNPLYRAQERFAFSFDLWEEKYSVFHSPPDGRSVSHLPVGSAEEWCLQNMPIPLDVIPDPDFFMIQLECFVEETEQENSGEEAPGLTLAGIIEYFSRKKGDQPHRWRISSGLLRLSDLKRTGTEP
ncbi:MAG: hypothetical protein P8Y80_02570 [Acidobacteriota bacterium]